MKEILQKTGNRNGRKINKKKERHRKQVDGGKSNARKV